MNTTDSLIKLRRACQPRWLVTVICTAWVLSGCEPRGAAERDAVEEVIDPMSTDSFVMRNPEILEDLLEQLSLHEIDYWVNDDGSIGFYVKDTSEVDRIANESINVWITSQ